MKQKILSKEELFDVAFLLLNVSQDIRFVAEFEMKDHKHLKKHLMNTHKDLIKATEMLFDD